MNAAPEAGPVPPTAALDTAFAALTRYDRGSGRGALLPIDDAVAAATPDTALRAALETRLVAVLRGPASAVAREYACEKLARIGGPDAAPALAALLSDPDLAHAAANALRAIPGEAASRALRQSLERLSGLPLLGAIAALGQRRDATSVAALAGFLGHAEERVATAAAAALGEIGTVAAARELQAFLARAPQTIRSALAEACLVCAEHLRQAGETRAARRLLDTLLGTAPAPHVRAAALRLLA
jgi:HEAT repeat protein